MKIRICIIAMLFCVGATSQPATMPAPTRVTLKLDHVALPEALKQLFDQAQVDASAALSPAFVEEMSDVKVTADLVDQPYAMALLELCRQGWLEPRQGTPSGGDISFAVRRPRSLRVARASSTRR